MDPTALLLWRCPGAQATSRDLTEGRPWINFTASSATDREHAPATYADSVTPDDLRTALLSGDLSRPRLTWYDDSRGERIDLSGKTLANWVAKAANWLETEMALAPGDVVRLDLPADHWRTIYWSLAAWTRGLTVTTDDDADASVSLDSETDSAAADLVEPAAALAASPLQAMPDAMPPPVGPVPLDGATLSDDVASGSRVFLSTTAIADIPSVAAALIIRGCSALIVRGGDEQTRSARSTSEAVDISL